jgi:hypothetical protein
MHAIYNTYIFGSSCSKCYSRGESGKDNIYVEQALELLRRQNTVDPPGARLLALQLALMTLVQKYLLY